MVQQHHLAGVTRQLHLPHPSAGIFNLRSLSVQYRQSDTHLFSQQSITKATSSPRLSKPSSVESALYCFGRHEHAQFRYGCKNRKQNVLCSVTGVWHTQRYETLRLQTGSVAVEVKSVNEQGLR